MTKSTQTHSFQAEIKELLDLMIHSLYSNREIFLRELISNSSDAIDKLKFESLTQPNLIEGQTDFEIRLMPNSEAHTLSILDNGIGMSREEVMENIGTIAHSGTKKFLSMKKEMANHPELIGQFGVGFYSSFMVAKKVVLTTQKAGTKVATRWTSEGDGTYSIEEAIRPEGHGTTLTLYLKGKEETADESGDDEHSVYQDYASEWTLKSLIKKYSDFISYPIKMRTVKQPMGTEKENEKEVKIEDEVLNSQKALWLKSTTETTPEEYSEFYRHLTHDWVDPLKTIHFKAEGTFEFSSILYIPGQKPWDFHHAKTRQGLSLYVKRVFIMGDCEDLLPAYLRFVRGVVDSSDLSLNVSREILQQDRQVARMRKSLTNKVMTSLKEMLEKDRPNYEKFWAQFGPTLKEGIPLEPSSVEQLQHLLIFRSTASDQYTTLKEYVERMKPEQKQIFFIAGDSLEQIQSSPYLEKLKSKGFEVLLWIDRVDEWLSQSLTTYGEKKLQSITAENLELDSESEKKEKEKEMSVAQEKFQPLIEKMKAVLAEQVKDVKLSDRLTESPACLVSSASDPSAHLEKILESMGQSAPKSKRILEINPHHPLYEKMLHVPAEHQKEWAEILYGQAVLSEGGTLADPHAYGKKIAHLMIEASRQF